MAAGAGFVGKRRTLRQSFMDPVPAGFGLEHRVKDQRRRSFRQTGLPVDQIAQQIDRRLGRCPVAILRVPILADVLGRIGDRYVR